MDRGIDGWVGGWVECIRTIGWMDGRMDAGWVGGMLDR